jgi:hypothetical protein
MPDCRWLGVSDCRATLHRHALLTLIAYLFLQHLRLHAATGGKKKSQRTTAASEPAGHPTHAA